MPSSVIALGSASTQRRALGEAERQGALGVGLWYGDPTFGNRAAGDTQAQHRVAVVIVQAPRAAALGEED
jgi:hypothetical protein